MHEFTTVDESFFKYDPMSDDDFVRTRSSWEVRFASTFGIDMAKFCSCVITDLHALFPRDPAKRDNVKWRWKKALFDSVDQFFVIDRFFRVVPAVLDCSNVNRWFGTTLASMYECDVSGTYNGGRLDLGIVEGDNVIFDLDHVAAVREKKDGLRFVRREESDGHWMCGGFVRFRMEEPVELMELVNGEFYSLYPVGLPTFSTKAGTIIKSHLPMHPGRFMEQEKDYMKMEGLMLFCKEGEHYVEKRVKVKPTVELRDYNRHAGIWEHELDVEQGYFYPVRPRPGKYPGVPATLNTLAAVSQLPKKSISNYEVKVVTTGAYSGMWQRRGDGSLTIDSGFRVVGDRLKHIRDAPTPQITGQVELDDVIWYQHGQAPFCVPKMHPVTSLSPPKIITSVKALIYDVDMQEFVTVREHDDRRFGLPGGRVEPGESGRIALSRELMEELGLEEVDPVYVGAWKSEEYGYVYYTMMYIILLSHSLLHPKLEMRKLSWAKPDLKDHESYVNGQYRYMVNVCPDLVAYCGYREGKRATTEGEQAYVSIRDRMCNLRNSWMERVYSSPSSTLDRMSQRVGVFPSTLCALLMQCTGVDLIFQRVFSMPINLLGPERVSEPLPKYDAYPFGGKKKFDEYRGVICWTRKAWLPPMESRLMLELTKVKWKRYEELLDVVGVDSGRALDEVLGKHDGKLWTSEKFRGKKSQYKYYLLVHDEE